jgi:hypothetical protein
MSEPQKLQQPEISIEGFPQSEIDSLFREISIVGAFKFFSELRDRAVKAGDELQMLAASMTEEEKAVIRTKALEVRNDIIVYQGAVDKSFEFENITSSEGRHVN